MDKNTKKVPYFPFGIPKCFNFAVQRIQGEEKTIKLKYRKQYNHGIY